MPLAIFSPYSNPINMHIRLFLLLVFTGLTGSFTVLSAQDISVTFEVDMREAFPGAADSSFHVGLRGNLAPLSWIKGIKLTDPDADGIFACRVHFPAAIGKTLHFKFVLNNVEWETGDDWTIKLGPETRLFQESFRYVQRPGNPFRKFLGEWTLLDDRWINSYGEGMDTIYIPDHHTLAREVNNDNSLLQIVDASTVKGHSLWVYDYEKQEVQQLSSFYPFRTGVGNGSMDTDGNLQLKVFFEGEPVGSYRVYTYTWLGPDQYELKSFQYNAADERTGNFYGGIFVRIKP